MLFRSADFYQGFEHPVDRRPGNPGDQQLDVLEEFVGARMIVTAGKGFEDRLSLWGYGEPVKSTGLGQFLDFQISVMGLMIFHGCYNIAIRWGCQWQTGRFSEGIEQFAELLGGNGSAEIVALHFVAPLLVEEIALIVGFDPLGNHA